MSASEDNSLDHFDIDLQKFYLVCLNKELDVLKKQNARDIKTALKEVVEAYKKPTKDIQDTKSIRFDTSAKRCAYVLKHSPCFTSAVGRHFLALVQERPCGMLDAGLSRGAVSICCIGGGPASDAVGVCRALSALHRPAWIKTRETLKVRVTVVDINEDWTVTAKNVISTLNENPELLGIEGVEVFFSFFKADLTKPIGAGLRRVMQEADVMTMVYFLSAVNRGRDQIESLLMVKEIMRHIREGSILFFLDSAMDVHYNQMSTAAESLGDMTTVYGPCIEEFHTLSLESVRRFLELYRRQFGKFLCLTNCFVTCCAWQKKTAPNSTLARLLGIIDSEYNLGSRSKCMSNDTMVEQFLGDMKKFHLLENDMTQECYECWTRQVLLNNSHVDMLRVFETTCKTSSGILNYSMDSKFNSTCQLMLDNEECSHNSHNLFFETSQGDKYGVLFMDTLSNFNNTTSNDNRYLNYKSQQQSMRQLLLDECTRRLQYQDKSYSGDLRQLDYNLILEHKCVCESHSNKSETLSNKRHTLENELVWRKSPRRAVSRQTAKMLQFRSQVDKLLAEVFEEDEVASKMFEDLSDLPPDDAFDSLMVECCRSVPEYFFQTKSKKKRIFTGLLVAN